MAKNNNSRDDESKADPSAKDGVEQDTTSDSVPSDEQRGTEAIRSLGDNPSEPMENEEDATSGTVADLSESKGSVDDDHESDGDGTAAVIEATEVLDDDGSNQSDRTATDNDGVEVEDNEAERNIDATIDEIDPTAEFDRDESDDDEGTVIGIESVDVDDHGAEELDENRTVDDLDSMVGHESGNGPKQDAEGIGDDQSGVHDSGDDAQQELTVDNLDGASMADGEEGDDEGIAKTIMEADLDRTQTVLMDHSDDPARPVVSEGGVGEGKPEKKKTDVTIRDAQEATHDGYESDPSFETIDSAVLASADIGETINPRELSDEDASAWSLAIQEDVPRSGHTVVSGSGPRRTWVDRQFERLRKASVSNVKGTQNVDDDYRLVRKLGQGGMGDVFVARQGSLNRLLALKLIKPLDDERRAQLAKAGKLESVEEERRQQFLSEAIVTGDLDHPNIVPIHDVAVTSKNELFYSMKRVVGTPWSKVIKKNSREENLDILMKSCDAIGFAHERGVVHRDIKPENIMLGDFGVVMVMDWGLAFPTSSYEKHDSVFATSGLGGTPAFMAPEMVTGPLEKIGPASDIYLLGATLFMIITGSAPHKAKNVTECLKAVRRNSIRKVSAAQKGELLNIAMRAMASEPKDRYPDVAAFQEAIREYRSHAASISLTVRATEDMELGEREASYAPLSRATFRFEEALKSWEDNERAKKGLEKTKLIHARIACDKGDYEFGLSILDRDEAAHAELISKLEASIKLRDSHAARVAVLRKAALAMLAFIIIFGSGALYVINAAKEDALAARAEEEKAKNEALVAKADEEKAKDQALVAKADEEKAKNEALAAKAEEEKAKNEALVAKADEEKAKNAALAAQVEEQKAKETAVSARQLAVQQQERAEYEEYISKIALAKARLERNEADGARAILLDLKSNPNTADRAKGWEWRWLWRQANQSEALGTSGLPVIDLGVSNSGRLGAVALSDGGVQILRLDVEGIPLEKIDLPPSILAGQHATCVAVSAADQHLAIGTDMGEVVLVTNPTDLSAPETRVVTTPVHKQKVTDICFTPQGTLWTASEDRTVCSWKQGANGALLKGAVCWHFLPVKQIAVAEHGQQTFLATVSGDGKTGKVVVWEQSLQESGPVLNLVGRMSGHPAPASAVAIDRTGSRIASGDLMGNVLVWNLSELSAKGETAHRQQIQNAVRQIDTPDAKESVLAAQSAAPIGFPLEDADASVVRRYVSMEASDPGSEAIPQAHSDAVETIRFSDDGEALLTASDDYTVKIWDLESGRLGQTLKGHGGWVVGAEFLHGQDDTVVSASDDTTVRKWKPKTYVGAFKSQQAPAGHSASTNPREEIWSASFSSDGTRIVIARGDHKAEVIGVEEGSFDFRQISELSLQEGTDFIAMLMQVDQQNNLLYIGSGDETIRIWDLERGVQVGEANMTGLNTAFALSNDGEWLLSGSSDSDVRGKLWKLDTKGRASPKQIHDFVGLPGQEAVTTFAFSPDAKTIFMGDEFGIGSLWSTETGKQNGQLITSLRGSRINDAVFTADGKYLFIAADNAAVTQIDLSTFKRVARLEQLGYVVQLTLSADGQHLLSVSEVANQGFVKTFATLWDLTSGLGKLLDLTVRTTSNTANVTSRARITSARFGVGNQSAYVSRTANENGNSEIRVWDLKQLLQANDFVDAEQMKQRVLEAQQSSNTGTVLLMPKVRGDIESLIPMGDERLLTMNNNGAFLWNLDTKKEEKSYRAHAELTEAAFSFDAKYVATASRSVKIWDAETGKALAKIEAERPIRTVQFSPVKDGESGYVFATGGDQGVVELWQFDPKTRGVTKHASIAPAVEVETEPKRPIRRIRFSKEGDRLWIVGDQGLARLRHLKKPAESITLTVPEDQNLTCAEISDDGRHLAAGSREKNVIVWKLPQPDEGLKTVVLSGHAGVVNDVGLIGDDGVTLRVFTASADGTARVWDPRFETLGSKESGVGREIISLRRHRGDVTALDATENGNLLMTAGRDGTVILWPADAIDQVTGADHDPPEHGKR